MPQAECEADIAPTQGGGGSQLTAMDDSSDAEADGGETRGAVKVGPEHIAKIAAELLMDFS